MNEQTILVINQCAQASYAGTLSFGEVVGRLAQAGVESYFADYRAQLTTYYSPAGDTYSIKLNIQPQSVVKEFSKDDIQAAIRGAQSGEVKYPEFLQRSSAAGCCGYWAWIAGRHVTYFGRKGEQHIERFPN
jgi:Phage envelope protein